MELGAKMGMGGRVRPAAAFVAPAPVASAAPIRGTSVPTTDDAPAAPPRGPWG